MGSLVSLRMSLVSLRMLLDSPAGFVCFGRSVDAVDACFAESLKTAKPHWSATLGAGESLKIAIAPTSSVCRICSLAVKGSWLITNSSFVQIEPDPLSLVE